MYNKSIGETNMKNIMNNVGSVSYETSRNKYRGFVTIAGQRFSTRRYPTRLGAKRALNTLIKNLTTLR